MTEIRGSEFLHVWIHSVPNMIFICVSLECVFFFEIWPDGDVRTLQQELFAFLLNLELVRWLVARQGHLTF